MKLRSASTQGHSSEQPLAGGHNGSPAYCGPPASPARNAAALKRSASVDLVVGSSKVPKAEPVPASGSGPQYSEERSQVLKVEPAAANAGGLQYSDERFHDRDFPPFADVADQGLSIEEYQEYKSAHLDTPVPKQYVADLELKRAGYLSWKQYLIIVGMMNW